MMVKEREREMGTMDSTIKDGHLMPPDPAILRMERMAVITTRVAAMIMTRAKQMTLVARVRAVMSVQTYSTIRLC